MNNQKEDIKRAAEVAQFRFGVIAPVVQDLYPDPSRTAYYKRVASSPFTLPDGSVVEYNYKTIEKWVSMYQRGGLEAHLCRICILFLRRDHFVLMALSYKSSMLPDKTTRLCRSSAQKMLFSDKLCSQEGKTADFIVQFPPLTIRRFTINEHFHVNQTLFC